MDFIMDMIHDNPGEERFKTKFREPRTIAEYGYNTQVFKHCNTVIDFRSIGENPFPTSESRTWLENMNSIVSKEFFDAKEAGLMTMSHIDLFVLPKLLVEKYKDEICDSDGRISIYKKKTKEIHQAMFDELFEKYQIDGLIIRVGETYLFDTPYHTGNGAVKYGNTKDEQDTFVELINFLVEAVCKRHGKYVIFRTWDLFPDKFHANSDYYLSVTDRIEPCDKLIFSIKHTALDFWRRVKFNPCIGKGRHRQIIEIQCQREYEGKGAYPSYIMDGVINGFSENKEKIGLKDVIDNPLICGVYTWSRGGGWFGPYLQNEFWCDLNTYVISHYANDPEQSELEVFLEFAIDKMGLKPEDAKKFHDLCIKSSYAILYGRYIEAYDRSLKESIVPCNNWMRDDRIGGLRQLDEIFEYLEQNNLVDEALKEKSEAVEIWKEINQDFIEIDVPDRTLKEFISNSIEYAIRLFTIVEISFNIFFRYRQNESCVELLEEYDLAWDEYLELENRPQASSSYKDSYYFAPDCKGLNETIALCRSSEKLRYDGDMKNKQMTGSM